MTASAELPALPFEYPTGVVGVGPSHERLQHERSIVGVCTPAVGEAWRVTRYQGVKELLDDPLLGLDHPGVGNGIRISGSGPFRGAWDNFEAEGQARFRCLLILSFAPTATRAIRPRVACLVGDRLDDLESGTPPVDLRDAWFLSLSLSAICEFLGVPLGDRARLRDWPDDLTVLANRWRPETAMARLLDRVIVVSATFSGRCGWRCRSSRCESVTPYGRGIANCQRNGDDDRLEGYHDSAR
jgi:cytochrome P450